MTTRIWTDIDLRRAGRQQGYLRLPFSSNESGYGWLPIPIVVVNRGDGPSVLLMAGNHGDEFEGQALLIRLIQTLPPEKVTGRLIILPAANAPAVAAGTRLSPIDGGNLNRSFPGDANGTVTQMIAHYIESVLLPEVDHVFDFHSGGRSNEYIPCAHGVLSSDARIRQQQMTFFRVFGMPNSIVIDGLMGGDHRLLGACERAGVSHMSTELGGGGTLNRAVLDAAAHGLRRLLHHLGVVDEPLTTEPAAETRFYRRQPVREFLYAPAPGLFEPAVDLGAVVAQHELAGVIHSTDEPWRKPVPVEFAADGTVLSRRVPARTEIGDMLFNLGVQDPDL